MEKNTKTNKPVYVSIFTSPAGQVFEMVFDKASNTTSFVAMEAGKQKLCATITTKSGTIKPLPVTDPLLAHNIVLFPSSCGSYESREGLHSAIDLFLRRYVSLSETEYSITRAYILLTWVYGAFNELPYLRVRGDYGSGKTRFLIVAAALCYKSIMTSGASTVAPLFHMIHKIGGTLILDEADFRYSSETAEITKILNNGNARGFPVLRCQKTPKGKFETVAYTVYGPKVIASRGDYDDEALESRCITLEMKSIGKKSTIPITLPDSFNQEADLLRDALLAFRFTEMENINVKAPIHYRELSPRTNQVYAALLSMVNSDKDRERILQYAISRQEQMIRDRGLVTEAEMLRVIAMHFRTKNQILSISDLTRQFIERFGNGYDRRITAKWVGGIVRKKLRLETRKTNGRYVIAENQKDKLEALYARYDVGD